MRVVVVDEHAARTLHLAYGVSLILAVGSRTHKVVQLALGLYHAFERTEALQMRTAHVCDERIVGLNDLHQRLDVARVRRAHLHDCYVVCRVQAQQCLGHADVVVEVALGVEHVVFLQKHRSREFLCGGLAVGSGDADDRRAERTSVIACELLQSVQTVVDENEASVALNDVLRFIDNSISAALLKRSSSKLVAVERSAFQGEEQRTDGAVATVGCNNGVLLKDFVKFGYFHFAFIFVGKRAWRSRIFL